jgi:serine/alanine adding enzyme
MNTNQKVQKKSILSNPALEYARLHPNQPSKNSELIRELEHKYQLTKQQHIEILDKTREISGKIGEAKQANQPFAELIEAMQKLTIQADVTKDNLHGIEKEILSFFELTLKNDNPAPIHFQNTRHYPISNIGCEEFTISLLTNEQKEWDQYVANNNATSIYHHTRWREVIHTCFRHETFYYYSKNSTGNINGILPLVRLRSRLFGDFLVSMPYFNYGGAVADHPIIEQKLIETANTLAEELGIHHVEYRDDIARGGFPARTDKVCMLLTLPGDEKELWSSFTSKLRAQIKRPQREALDILSGGIEYLDDFYKVFSHNMRDLGTPVYSIFFFRKILSSYTKNTSIIVIRLDGRPVAACFLIGDRNVLEIPWASSLKEANHLSVNMLLYWEALRFAIRNEYSFFDFGRSTIDSGTFRFKKQWGAKPKQLHWHYWLKNSTKIPLLNPNNTKYKLMIEIWKRLPIRFTTLLGPLIVKNLP